MNVRAVGLKQSGLGGHFDPFGLRAHLELCIDARQLSTLVLGYRPPVVVPWKVIGIGTGIVLAISLIASLAPALGVSRAQPLELLQAGRAAT